MTTLASLDLARHPEELATCIVAVIGGAIAFGYLAYLVKSDRRKD